MPDSINNCQLRGFLGQDPKFFVTQNNLSIAKFSVATNERRKKDGEWVNETEWHNCTAFGKQAEMLRDTAHKGSKVHVEGSIQTHSWNAKDKDGRETGEKRYMTGIRVKDVYVLPHTPKPRQQETEAHDTQPSKNEWGHEDERLPFE